MGVNTATRGDPDRNWRTARSPKIGALFGMELGSQRPCRSATIAAKLTAVLGFAIVTPGLARIGVIGVHEIEVAATWECHRSGDGRI